MEKDKLTLRPLIVDVVIPAFNEAENIGLVINDIPKNWVREIVVCDNNSTDETALRAKEAGAIVVSEKTAGYGNACLKALNYIKNKPQQPDVIVFLDGDYSDDPKQLPLLIEPIIGKNAANAIFYSPEGERGGIYWGGDLFPPIEMVIGSRVRGDLERGALTVPQRFGNWLATTLIRWIYGLQFTDLGPFRAITFDALERMNMQDKNYGWTVEMQVKAAKLHIRSAEVAVNYRRRHAGVSKVSGSVKGSILAGHKILYTIFKYL